MVLQDAVEALEQAVVGDEEPWLEPMPRASVTTASSSNSGSSGTTSVSSSPIVASTFSTQRS